MYLLGLSCNANFFITKRPKHKNLSMSKMSGFQWPLFMFTSEHLSPPQRLPLGIPIKISIIEKIESVRGTMERGKRLPIVPRVLSFLSPQPPHNTKRPLRRRECEHKIPKPSLVCELTSLHLHSLCINHLYSQVPCEFI